MNSVNVDLNFTMELVSDFADNRLPTLSFSMWPTEGGISHSYFEKSMRNQTLLMENSAIGRQSQISIMSNELRRRLEVMSEDLDKKEIIGVIDKYTQQLTNSGYNRKQQYEIIVSALKGNVRKENEMKRKCQGKRYRSGKDSLKSRMEKKLTEKYNWFRRQKKIGEKKNVVDRIDNMDQKTTRIKVNGERKLTLNQEGLEEEEKPDDLVRDHPKA